MTLRITAASTLIDPHSRIIQSVNQRTGEVKDYPLEPEPKHSWRRRVGAGLIAVSVLGAALVFAIKIIGA